MYAGAIWQEAGRNGVKHDPRLFLFLRSNGLILLNAELSNKSSQNAETYRLKGPEILSIKKSYSPWF
jgi:hypothetical protein